MEARCWLGLKGCVLSLTFSALLVVFSCCSVNDWREYTRMSKWKQHHVLVINALLTGKKKDNHRNRRLAYSLGRNLTYIVLDFVAVYSTVPKLYV